MLRLAVVSSLFPQLSGRSRGAVPGGVRPGRGGPGDRGGRGAAGPGDRRQRARGAPALPGLRVSRSTRWRLRSRCRPRIIFVVGAGLGVGWGLLLGPVAADSLLPGYAPSLPPAGVLRVRGRWSPRPASCSWWCPSRWRGCGGPSTSEALDGFTAGAAGALGLTLAATLTELAPLLRDGNLVAGLIGAGQAHPGGRPGDERPAGRGGRHRVHRRGAVGPARAPARRRAAAGSPSRCWRWRSLWPCRSGSASPTTRGSRTSPCSSSTSPPRRGPAGPADRPTSRAAA